MRTKAWARIYVYPDDKKVRVKVYIGEDSKIELDLPFDRVDMVGELIKYAVKGVRYAKGSKQ